MITAIQMIITLAAAVLLKTSRMEVAMILVGKYIHVGRSFHFLMVQMMKVRSVMLFPLELCA
ncbi:MAG: hypothetical protein A2Y62_07730 [Candidatus Fischerbacteria bacterium RBG_13_37_8]|uniref:Uncharacterized protein n=1 Tax=Candidatus Fischerbacteria bacterium RBG_13_37_8 TaxID=1817863 RepID=A0A1F5V965_9BACT|nr:MAG: hypothetical protein A2Y62_07730 [Candidatus Fischerbacteria bacterium RBG_13_37_8]